MNDQAESRSWTNHAGGYYVCSHRGCAKKANPFIPGHDCCGRCIRGRVCLSESQVNYDGPGTFAHASFVVVLRPGVCDVCGEPPEAH